MKGAHAIANSLTFAGLLFTVSAPAVALAQKSAPEVPRDEAAFVNQAPEAASSKVYLPEPITPESVAAARARAARQLQIEAATAANRADRVAQVSSQDGSNEVAQLSDGSSSAALAQLSAAERRVLIDAVEGSDICERGSDIPAIQALCAGRLENRSEEFARSEDTGSAEDNLLGGDLDSSGTANLESAIRRLAEAGADPGAFSNQAVASVALNDRTAADAQGAVGDADPTADLSQDTQALVAAIVQQLGGGN